MNTPAEIPADTPAEKLARSRARLVDALGTPRQTSSAGAKSHSGVLPSLLAMLWAQQHPIRSAGHVVTDAVDSLVAPWVRKHPLCAVAGAAAVGGLLVWSRPWRWARPSALLAGILPQLLSKLMAHQETQQHAAAVARHGSTSKGERI